MKYKSLRNKARYELMKDLFFIILGAVIAVVLAQVGLIDRIVSLFGNVAVASFVAGVFFTSAFTLAPSTIVLARIMEHAPIGTVALWGALGAMFGDLILFFFIRDRFADDLLYSMRPSLMKHVLSSFHLGFMKWLSPLVGALVIASPLPDEFGMMLMGMSRVRVAILMPVSFVMNVLGIYSVLWFGSIV